MVINASNFIISNYKLASCSLVITELNYLQFHFETKVQYDIHCQLILHFAIPIWPCPHYAPAPESSFYLYSTELLFLKKMPHG